KIMAKLEEDTQPPRSSLASLSEKEETESFTFPSSVFEHPSVGQPRSSSLGASFHSEVGPIDRHQEVLASTQDALASLASIIEEFHSWRCIPIPSILRATLEKFDSTVVSFLDLDSSSIPLGRYSTLSAMLIRESTRLESEFRVMVDRFASLKEKGLTPVYDGTQPLDTSEDIDELIVKELPPCDGVDLHSTLGTSKSSSVDGALGFDSIVEESMDSKVDVEDGLGDNSIEDLSEPRGNEGVGDDEEENDSGSEEESEHLDDVVKPDVPCVDEMPWDVENKVVPMTFGASFRVIEDCDKEEEFTPVLPMIE
ncbi:Unknown protein, partial [Striga hermonthica]